MTTIVLPVSGGGVPIYASPASLPTSATTGDVVSVVSDSTLRQWSGSVWVVVGSSSGGTLTGVANTNSINLTNTGGTVTGDVNLSAASATANNQLVNLSIQTDGVRAQLPNTSVTGLISATAPVTATAGVIAIPVATGAADGYLSSANFTTFNSKVGPTRAINTTSPLTGGGDLSADRTLAIPASTTSVDGYLASADFTTFNSKVGPTRTISTTAPITGGGDLSANRTIAIPASTTAVDGYLTSTDWNTFNNKTPTARTISTTAPLSGGGDLTTNRTLAISQSTTSTDGYLSSTDWNTFNNKSPALPAFSTAQLVYVSNGGNDTTGDGTMAKPYLTITKAFSVITDASISKRYAVMLNPGFYSENVNISLKPYVYLVGRDRTANRINLNGNNFILGSGWDTGSQRMGMFNVYLTGTTGIILDFGAAGGTGSNVIELDTVGLNGPFTFTGRAGSADFTQIANTLFFGAVTLNTGLHSFQNCQLNSTLTINTAANLDNVQYTGFNNVYQGAISLASSTTFTNTTILSASYTASTIALTGSGTTLSSDVGSLPNPSSITNTGGTITYSSYPANLNGFTAAVRGSLSATAPTTYNSSTGVIAMPVSTTSVDGYLAATDFTTFNNKVSSTRAINTTSPITGGGDLSADRTIAIPAATGSVNGYLTSTDFTTFNGKQSAITVGSLGAGNANGLDLTAGTLTLHAATSTQPGAVSATTQTLAGDKTFAGNIIKSNNSTNASFVSTVGPASTFATSANLTTATCTFASPQLMFNIQVQVADGTAFTVACNYASTAISAPSDPSGIFLPSDSGVGVYVFKSATSGTISFKNRTGSSQTIGIQSLAGNFSSTTAWA